MSVCIYISLVIYIFMSDSEYVYGGNVDTQLKANFAEEYYFSHCCCYYLLYVIILHDIFKSYFKEHNNTRSIRVIIRLRSVTVFMSHSND